MAKSVYLKTKVLTDNLLAGTRYLALYNGDPENGGTELSGGSYVRKAITFGTVSNGSVANTVAINFVNMPGSTVTHWAILDASTSGNLLYVQQTGVNIVLTSGTPFDIAIGNLVITES